MSQPSRQLSERPLLLLLAAVQFTHIMDFMIMMPLGPQLMRVLAITPGQFGSLISSYTWTSGLLGLLVAPFIDRFDRRKLILWTYAGFSVGTLACALSHSAGSLLLARAVCGAFGGVSNVLVLVIASDAVPPARRAQAMGIIMTAFSVAAALGVPFGLQLAHLFRWEMPFVLLAAISAVVWVALFVYLPSLRNHISTKAPAVWRNFADLLRNRNVGWALFFMVTMVFGHFSVIPFLSPHLVLNVHLPEKYLALVYLVGGVLTIFTAPIIGKLADRHGRQLVFTVLVVAACVIVYLIANAGPLPVFSVLVLGGLFFIFASGRFVPGQAIISMAVPAEQRGSFMSLSACTRDLASGLSTTVGSMLVTGTATQLVGFNWLGWMAIGVSILSLWVVHKVRLVEKTVRPVGVTTELAAGDA